MTALNPSLLLPLPDRQQLLEIARDAAMQAAPVVREGFARSGCGGIANKGALDLVTETDKASEAMIRQVIGAR